MFTTVLVIFMAVVSGLITILAAVAPLTSSDLDNKLLDLLRKLRDLVVRLIGGAPVDPAAAAAEKSGN